MFADRADLAEVREAKLDVALLKGISLVALAFDVVDSLEKEAAAFLTPGMAGLRQGGRLGRVRSCSHPAPRPLSSTLRHHHGALSAKAANYVLSMLSRGSATYAV